MTLLIKHRERGTKTIKNVILVENRTTYQEKDTLHYKIKDDKGDGEYILMKDIYAFKVTV